MANTIDLKKDFQKLIANGGLSHSYLFFGHESAEEKILFAKELANFLENKKWGVDPRPLNDAHFLNAAEDGGIDLVRSASQFLWQRPAISSKRTLVINDADRFTLPAQNAILKISEEPPAHALLLLLVKHYDGLLPALYSRFQKIYVHSERDTNTRMHTNDTNTLTKQFLKAGSAQRKEIIKEVVEEGTGLENFVTGIITELRKDMANNWPALKELLYRWTLINQFNTNKRLQLEAALIDL